MSKSLELEPDNTVALQWRAGIHEQAGDHEQALADTARVLRLNPGSPAMHFLRATIFRAQGRNESAIAEADVLIASRPDAATTRL